MKSVINIVFSVFCLFFLHAPVSYAAWPSWEKVVTTLAPIAGLDPDEIEAIKFSVSNPSCASTIVSYTAAQDYSLIGFVAALKATKIQNVSKVIPVSKQNCKSLNAVQRAYQIVDRKGNEILGKTQADFLRQLLAEQIAQGKSEIDTQIASIPYIGTILANWDCGCDAAFQTNFPTEKIINAKVGAVVSISKDIKKKDIGSAAEKIIKLVGPEAGCKLLATYSGVEAIPIVNTAVNQVCSSALGEAVDWLVDGLDSIGQALGVTGYEAIAPEEYYKIHIASLVHYKDAKESYFLKKADNIQKDCEKYYGGSKLSKKNVQKVCTAIKHQYVEEMYAAKDWNEWRFAMTDYNKIIAEEAKKGIFKKDKEFKEFSKKIHKQCEDYLKDKYPKALQYRHKKEIEYCNYDYVYSVAINSRKSAQKQYVEAVASITKPFCKLTHGNTVVSCDDDGYQMCTNYMPQSQSCAHKTFGFWGESEKPCCKKSSSATDAYFKANVKATKEYTMSIDGGIYCKPDPKNPLKIICTLEKSYEKCQSSIAIVKNQKCETAEKYDSGIYATRCCAYQPEKIKEVPGVSLAKAFIATENLSKTGSCSAGGQLLGFSFDPRIINCSSASYAKCMNTHPKSCSLNKQGFATGVCCEQSVFSSDSNISSNKDKRDDNSARTQPARSSTTTSAVPLKSTVSVPEKSVINPTAPIAPRVIDQVSPVSREVESAQRKEETTKYDNTRADVGTSVRSISTTSIDSSLRRVVTPDEDVTRLDRENSIRINTTQQTISDAEIRTNSTDVPTSTTSIIRPVRIGR